ncbi:MAG TPA: hypothetical protein PK536_13985 [Ignavibacteria bacterium]|nr:hypothetical protein [Bacteroidota bacterium]HRI86549.1 hypothetical protein [Ignavibacteria bacterium]HRK00368.1 hypothetical protein [Ignavibacteria bacterium]
MWDPESGNGTATASKTFVKCNTKEYDVTDTIGIALVEKIKSIARENQIGKFDIFDAGGKNISSTEVENGNYSEPLSIVRYNVAAA